MGLLVSPSNPSLIELLRPLFNATLISAASDLLFLRVLADEAFIEQFLADNRTALRTRRGQIYLTRRFTCADAGVYVVVDLAPFIARITDPSNSDIAKLERIDARSFSCKPTTCMADPVPTRFRLVFTQPRPTMEVR
ncbi:hypothetical protein B0H11DRAFT_2355600, partial [Mycena galericulata]